jgi:hypothetical protein
VMSAAALYAYMWKIPLPAPREVLLCVAVTLSRRAAVFSGCCAAVGLCMPIAVLCCITVMSEFQCVRDSRAGTPGGLGAGA